MIREPYIYSYGRCLAPPQWNFMKMLGCDRVYVVYGGSGWYCDSDGEHPFTPGCVYLFPMRAGFRVRQLQSDPLDHMYFDFSLTPPFCSGRISSIDISGEPTGLAAPVKRMVEALELLLSHNEPLPPETVRTVFGGLLQLLCLAAGQHLSNDPRVELALERIHRLNADGSLDIPNNDELASLLHIDANHFIRIFRREVGVTPHKYILSHRLNVAEAYIGDGVPVTDAARLVGYESVSALSHALKHRRSGADIRENAFAGSKKRLILSG